jgi:hypothetical protein
MSRVVTRTCDRCPAVLTDRSGSILETKAGELVGKLPAEVDLCKECSDLFISFMHSESGRSSDPTTPLDKLS